MRIFTVSGILFYLLYLTVIDQAFDQISVPYQSPFSMLPTKYKDAQYTGMAIRVGGGVAVLMLAAVLTRLTPTVF